MEGAHVVGRHRLQVAHPAYHRPVVGRGGEHHRVLLLAEQGARLVVGAQAPLLLDHLDLALELIVGPLVAGEAVGFELHHVLQPGRGNLLVVAGVVARGEGVLAASQRGDAARELAGLQVLAALEHHVLERVRDARGAVDLVDRADAHPDHLYRRRRAPIGLHDHRHAVGESELAGGAPARFARKRRTAAGPARTRSPAPHGPPAGSGGVARACS